MDTVIKLVSKPETLRSQCLIIPLHEDGKLSREGSSLNKASGNRLSALIRRGDASGKVGESLLLPGVDGIAAERVLLLGCGQRKGLSASEFRKLASALFKTLHAARIKDACLFLDTLSVAKQNTAWMVAQLALQGELESYRYARTLSKPKPAPQLKKLTVSLATSRELTQAAREGRAIGRGMNAARELGNLPGNICTPTYLAQQARALARGNRKFKTSVLEEKRMRELGMGALLSVTAGTSQPAKLITINYSGGKKTQKPYVLVGKGITFDSGGISLKPGAAMDEMKFDMCGAASVIGTLQAIAELALPINVVGLIAAAENLPSGTATKPGDVVTSMSGQTIEILNTDAEGRLVLCDTLTYAARFKPAEVIDIATLTGACVVALGRQASGLYSNQDDFAAKLLAAGEQIGDRAWQMPLWEEYQQQLSSNFADMANIGGPDGGSITAASFLARYTKDYRWAHLDIAGTAWLSGASKGATGRPVGLLVQHLINAAGGRA